MKAYHLFLSRKEQRVKVERLERKKKANSNPTQNKNFGAVSDADRLNQSLVSSVVQAAKT